MTIPTKDSCTKVRNLRLTRGIGQADLAARLGITGDALNHFEKGRRGFSVERLEKVANILGVSVTTFVQENDVLIVGDLREIRLLTAWRALRNKRTIKMDFLRLMKDLVRHGF
jgi:transcriptional regulator with XRE-family HTH domain